NEEFLGDLTIQRYIIAREALIQSEDDADKKAIAEGGRPKKRVRDVLWTDQQSDLFSILK
ncbi:MAG: hypothetical protein IAF94_22335, partial [Pirellulaceae bacterium]|nr:hypothetical protein [Pirellulaceae bacterium]